MEEETVNIQNTLRDIEIDNYIHDNYIKECYDIVIVKCRYNSEEFYNYLQQDYYVQRDIEMYNHKSGKDYNFATYMTVFDYNIPMLAQRCLNSNEWTLFKTTEEYEFKFTIKNSDDIPTFEEYKESKTIRKEYDDNDFEIKNNLNITPEEFIERIKSEKRKRKGKAGRRSNDKKIEKYDLDNNLIETYNNRSECIEKNNLKKSALSLHLNGKRKTLNGYIYKEKTE